MYMNVPTSGLELWFVTQENMTRMLMVTDVQDVIKRHQAQIITSLKDPDIRWYLNVQDFM